MYFRQGEKSAVCNQADYKEQFMANQIVFNVVDRVPSAPLPQHAYLVNDRWDDWSKYQTLYELVYYDEESARHEIGYVKIAEVGLEASPRIEEGKRRAKLPQQFYHLDNRYFSLGSGIYYYENMDKLPNRQDLLVPLRDCAYDRTIYEQYRDENVMKESLRRDISDWEFEKYVALATGHAVPLPYDFIYSFPKSDLKMEVKVDPDSVPPTNIYAIIGSNGVGKTSLLTNMYRTAPLEDPDAYSDLYGKFDFLQDEAAHFSKVVVISFNSFDNLPAPNEKELAIPVCIYGWNTYKEYKVKKSANTHIEYDGEKEKWEGRIAERIKGCRYGTKKERMFRTLSNLESDPIFHDADIKSLLDVPENNLLEAVKKIYNSLSSGHRVILLTAVHLVDSVDEETLVLMDEPESHLHPPLLSAFIRTMSDLLKNRNAVAILATHSPIVLQEVLSSCVYQLIRSGNEVDIFHPKMETFGESVQALTKEVFHLEIMSTGFFQFITNIVKQYPNKEYEEFVENIFNNHLGSEGKAILLTTLYANRKSHEKD